MKIRVVPYLFFCAVIVAGCASTPPPMPSGTDAPESVEYPARHYLGSIKVTSLRGDSSPTEETDVLVRHRFLPLEDTIIEETWSREGHRKITLVGMDGIGVFRISDRDGQHAGVRNYIGTEWAWHQWESEIQWTDGTLSMVTKGERRDRKIIINREVRNTEGAASALVVEKYEEISEIQFDNRVPSSSD